MDRQRFYERDRLTYEEKHDILAKSDGKCAHCGDIKFINYGATIDHFIPISKGGLDRNLNMVMLCEKCNKEKGNKIVDTSYLKYLKEEYVKPLETYVNDYIKVFDYIDRKRMFAYDEYEFTLANYKLQYIMDTGHGKHLKNINNTRKALGSKYVLRRAGHNDFLRVCDYFEKYLKKYDALKDRTTVELNISFWMKFGSIYYLEKNGEIYMMFVFTIKHLPITFRNHSEIEYCLNTYIFSYYASESAYSLAYGLLNRLSGCILSEQDIKYIPVDVNMMHEDKLAALVFTKLSQHCNDYLHVDKGPNGFDQVSINMTNKTEEEIYTNENQKAVCKFFKQFDDITYKIISFFQNNNASGWVDWMLYDVLSCYDILEYQLFDENSEDEDRRIMADLNTRLCEYYDRQVARRNMADELLGKKDAGE